MQCSRQSEARLLRWHGVNVWKPFVPNAPTHLYLVLNTAPCHFRRGGRQLLPWTLCQRDVLCSSNPPSKINIRRWSNSFASVQNPWDAPAEAGWSRETVLRRRKRVLPASTMFVCGSNVPRQKNIGCISISQP